MIQDVRIDEKTLRGQIVFDAELFRMFLGCVANKDIREILLEMFDKTYDKLMSAHVKAMRDTGKKQGLSISKDWEKGYNEGYNVGYFDSFMNAALGCFEEEKNNA